MAALSAASSVALTVGLSGCSPAFIGGDAGVLEPVFPAETRLYRYHVRRYMQSLEEFSRRLYAKNPIYEKDPARRLEKIKSIFGGGRPVETLYYSRASHELLTAAFAPKCDYPDRVYLLSLGLARSFQEAYGVREDPIISSLQVQKERLEKLHANISQVKWRLKTYRHPDGSLLFHTNEAGDGGYINMGFEVIFVQLLTRVEDDIYLKGGFPANLIFDMTTLFLTIIY
jgi:hypothetical protein